MFHPVNHAVMISETNSAATIPNVGNKSRHVRAMPRKPGRLFPWRVEGRGLSSTVVCNAVLCGPDVIAAAPLVFWTRHLQNGRTCAAWLTSGRCMIERQQAQEAWAAHHCRTEAGALVFCARPYVPFSPNYSDVVPGGAPHE